MAQRKGLGPGRPFSNQLGHKSAQQPRITDRGSGSWGLGLGLPQNPQLLFARAVLMVSGVGHCRQ
jgi:hypothetical protein